MLESVLSVIGVSALALLPFLLLGLVARLLGVDTPEMNADDHLRRTP